VAEKKKPTTGGKKADARKVNEIQDKARKIADAMAQAAKNRPKK
jgi:hypothetical protein